MGVFTRLSGGGTAVLWRGRGKGAGRKKTHSESRVAALHGLATRIGTAREPLHTVGRPVSSPAASQNPSCAWDTP